MRKQIYPNSLNYTKSTLLFSSVLRFIYWLYTCINCVFSYGL